jgi:Domain of unknown function (DUF4345)
MNKFVKPSNLHLTISIIIVMMVAFVYGFKPDLWFDVKVVTIDEFNIYKAIMGVYIAFSSLWFIGIIREKFWQTATISNALFMIGLAFGRIISLLFDGIPSTIFLLGTIGELILGFYAFYQFKKSKE